MGVPQGVLIPLSCTSHCSSAVVYRNSNFFIVLQHKFNKAMELNLETFRLLEIFQEFSSVFLCKKHS